MYNICSHEEAYREVGSQAISYTTGVPAMIGAKLMLEKAWHKPGVWHMEQFDPDPFMDALNATDCHGPLLNCNERLQRIPF